MTLAERPLDIPKDKEDASAPNISFRIRLLAIQGILKQIETIARREQNLKKLEKIGQAVSNLSQAKLDLTSDPGPEAKILFEMNANLNGQHTVIGRRKEAVRIASAKYDMQVFPTGMTSEIAVETAPTFKLSVDEAGELQVQELNPKTLEPISND